MKAPTDPDTLVSRTEIREMLGEKGKSMSRQRVGEVVEQESFPAPVDVVHPGSSQPIWRKADVEAWGRDHRRGPGRPTDSERDGLTPGGEPIVPSEPLS